MPPRFRLGWCGSLELRSLWQRSRFPQDFFSPCCDRLLRGLVQQWDSSTREPWFLRREYCCSESGRLGPYTPDDRFRLSVPAELSEQLTLGRSTSIRR